MSETEPYQFGHGRGHVPPFIAKMIRLAARKNGAVFETGGGGYWFTVPGGEGADRSAREVVERLREAGVWALLMSCTERQIKLKRSYR